MSWTPVKVYSRAEFEKLLADNPMHLRAVRPSRPPRPGNPDFIGPVDPKWKTRYGAINYDQETGEFYVNLPPRT